MAQARQDSALRSRYAQSAVMQAVAGVNTRTACAQLEQLERKLAAAHAEIRRYQTKLFACEREMIALRKENAELETACEQAREEAAQAAAQAEQLLQAQAQEICVQEPETEPAHPEAEEAAPQGSEEEPALPETPEPEQQAAPQPPAEPEWKPKTELEHLSVELINWFDEMMGA